VGRRDVDLTAGKKAVQSRNSSRRIIIGIGIPSIQRSTPFIMAVLLSAFEPSTNDAGWRMFRKRRPSRSG